MADPASNPSEDHEHRAAAAGAIFPCSAAQERFWVLDQLEADNPALNIAVRWQLEGRVAAEILEQAAQSVIRRHEILRTAFAERGGVPYQSVAAATAFHISWIDLTALPAAQRTAEAERIGMLEACAPFDLAAPPALRISLLRMTASRSLVLLTVHHLVCDGWSIGILAREIGQAYAAIRRGQSPERPALALQYGDYALWQREWLACPELDRERDYWTRQLAALPYFELPTDFPRGSGRAAGGRITSRLLARTLTDPLQAIGQARGCTLFTTALAALAVVLHRYSGETDIGIGTQVTGRDEVELEELVGLFINTLVLRVDLSGDPGFADLLDRVARMVQDALANQHMPIEQLVRELRPARDGTRNPLFSVNFIFQRSFVHNDAFGEFRLIDLPSHSPGALYDLNFFMVERPEGWRASCEYNAELFEDASVATMLACLEQVFAAIVAAAATPISMIPLLDQDACTALIGRENHTAAAYPRDVALPDLLRAQALRTPDRIALVAGGRTLSYRQLDGASNRLARYLRDRGIGAGALVGVCLDRSPDMVVALLGVMKSGAAYVPLDPSYPARRLAQVIEDADLAAILTAAGAEAALPVGPVERIRLDRQGSEIAQRSQQPLEVAIPADDLAYVIFTSGSTGRPKGVRIAHRALVNLLCGMADSPGIDASDVLVAVTTIAFDIAALEVFLPLLVGAKLVLADRETAADGHALAKLLAEAGATVLQATPVTWQILLDAGWRGAPQFKMLCGGEALSRSLADRLLPLGELWNMYGPTETTIWSSALRVSPGRGPVPIGPPMANTVFHVLDAAMRLVPSGAVGELFIGGDGVADGYLDRPELTAERFTADPFAPGGRLYRTGDLVRRRPGGGLAFFGRSDQQIKLRGFRIELGEIEAALLAQPEIAEAAAMVWRDAGESLAAYVVAQPAGTPPGALVATLRARIAQILPAYMHPSSIVVLAAMPRTPNGKLDRAALRDHAGQASAPAPADAERDAAPSAVMDPIETRLGEIWCALLGITAVRTTDNFFELGGHSLLGARMLAEVATAFGRRLPLALLFRAPSLGEFAAIVRQQAAPAFDYQLVEVQKSSTGTPIFAINHTWIYHPLAKQLGRDQAFYATHMFEPDGTRSIEETAALHVRVIRHVRPHGPYIVLGLCSAGSLAYEIAQQLAAAGEAVPLTVLIDAWAPDYLARLPWRQARLADWSYRAQMLVYDFRREGAHSLADAWRFCTRRLRNFLVKHSVAMVLPSPAAGEGAPPDPVLALDIASHRYRPRPLAGRMLLFYREEMPSGRFLDRHLGWDEHAGRDLRVVALPGDHFEMFRRPGVDLMAAEINRALRGEPSAAES